MTLPYFTDTMSKKRPGKLITVFLAFLFAASSGCKKKHQAGEIEISGRALGSTFSIKYNSLESKKSTADISDYLKNYFINFQNITSLYQEDSELIRINNSPYNKPIKISNTIGNMLTYAIALSAKTGGAYDVTAGKISKIWSNESLSTTKPQQPDDNALKIAKRSTGYKNIIIVKKGSEYWLQRKSEGLMIDLASLAAGYAADEISAYLSTQGIQNYLVNVGGEFRSSASAEKKWFVGLENPLGNSEVISRLVLINKSLATSGNYKNSSNIIDPRKAEPVKNRLLSVSVVTDSCMEADALATALFVLGKQKALEFAKQNKLAVLISYIENNVIKKVYSEEFFKYIAN